MGARTKPNLSAEDQAWVEEQLSAIPGLDEGYSEAQFEADVERAIEPLSELAQKARLEMEAGTARKFPR